MGFGAIFLGQIAEMLVPTLLIFAITYAAAKSSLKLSDSTWQKVGLFLAVWLISGVLNAFFYELTSDSAYGIFIFMGIPLVVSLLVIFFFSKKTKAKLAK